MDIKSMNTQQSQYYQSTDFKNTKRIIQISSKYKDNSDSAPNLRYSHLMFYWFSFSKLGLSPTLIFS